MDEPLISVRNLTAVYDDRVVLDDIDVDIRPHEITIILGESGCGKTTFLKNITRLYEPKSGSVRFFGQEIIGLEQAAFSAILRKTGMLFQNGALLNSLSVFDNIGIPLAQHTNLPFAIRSRMIMTKLRLVKLAHAAERFPSELSGGMRKRAGLARAIILDPDIVFFDEPSAGLDPVTSAGLDETILMLKSELGMTPVIVTHELASIHRIADRILFLDGGKLVFEGTVEETRGCGVEAVERFFAAGRALDRGKPRA